MSRRRKGISVVESLILMVVVGITLMAIMSTAIWATDLQIASRENIGSYVMVNNWFEALESVDPASLDTNFNAAVASLGKLVGDRYKVAYTKTDNGHGAYTIQLTLTPSSSRHAPLVISKDINRFSNATVPDNEAIN